MRLGAGWRQQCKSAGSCHVLALDLAVWQSSVTAAHLYNIASSYDHTQLITDPYMLRR